MGTAWAWHAMCESALKMGPIGCPEKSVRNYHYTVRNSPEERSSWFCQLLRLYGVVDIRMNIEHFWIYTEKERQKFSYKNFSRASFSKTNSTWIGLGLKLGLCSERPETNRLSHYANLKQILDKFCVCGNLDCIHVDRDSVQWIRYRNFGLHKSRISVMRSLTNSFVCWTFTTLRLYNRTWRFSEVN